MVAWSCLLQGCFVNILKQCIRYIAEIVLNYFFSWSDSFITARFFCPFKSLNLTRCFHMFVTFLYLFLSTCYWISLAFIVYTVAYFGLLSLLWSTCVSQAVISCYIVGIYCFEVLECLVFFFQITVGFGNISWHAHVYYICCYLF